MPSLGGFLRRSKSEGECLMPGGRNNNGHPSSKACSFEQDTLPEIDADSEILSSDEILKISRELPKRIEGAEWHLTFSTTLNGFSLASLYRKMEGEGNSPTLLVVQDTCGEVFGALASCPLVHRDTFYGTGESFLFTVQPKFRVFRWSGDNQLFVRGCLESLVVGAGEGRFGLYIDNSLYQGRSQTCLTYLNEPLASGGDFLIKTLECWNFS